MSIQEDTLSTLEVKDASGNLTADIDPEGCPLISLPPELHIAVSSFLSRESDYQSLRLTCKHLYKLLYPPGLRPPARQCEFIKSYTGFDSHADRILFLGGLMRDMDRAKHAAENPDDGVISTDKRAQGRRLNYGPRNTYKYKYYCFCRQCSMIISALTEPKTKRICSKCKEYQVDHPHWIRRPWKMAKCGCGDICKLV